MLEAAGQAGFPNVEGMDEAQAAIHAVTLQSESYLKKEGYLREGRPCTVLLIDMGAGTTDLALCRYMPGDSPVTETLVSWPVGGNVLFGGREADELLRDYARTKLPEDMAEKILSKCSADKFKAWKENTVSPGLLRNDTVENFPDLDMIAELYDVEMEPWHLTRQTFEEKAEAYLKKFPALIRGCIAASGVKDADIELVILTGGHSQWYFVKEILTGRLPAVCGSLLPQITEDPDRILSVTRPQETVALGLVYAPMASFSGSPAGLADAEDITENVYVMDAEGFGGASKSAASPVVLPESAGSSSSLPEPAASSFSLSELVEKFTAGQDFVHPGRGDFAVKNMTLLREYLGISAGEKVYLACDTTLLGTCKYGYAFAESGVYSRRYGGMEFISWEIFADSGFRPFDIGEFGIGIGPLTLCHTKTGEPGNALRFIEELQKYLRQNRKQG